MTKATRDQDADVYGKWGKSCNACGTTVGLQIHHIDRNRSNNDIRNRMPLCASCHQEVHAEKYVVDPATREIHVASSQYYRLAPHTDPPPPSVASQVEAFYSEIPGIPERQDYAKLTLVQDKANGVFFIDCHLTGDDLAAKLDPRTRLRVLEGDVSDEALQQTPEDIAQEDETYVEFGFNREIQARNPVFIRMTDDAEKGRSFLGIVLEWDQNYSEERPLKILGGQHRYEAVRRAVDKGEEVDRWHSVRVHFGLSAEQQAEIIDVYNANIDVPKALWDRIGEQLLGDLSRAWCERVGLLEAGETFSDRVSQNQPLTAQVVRCLVLNFLRGQRFKAAFEGEQAVFLKDVDIVPTGAMTATAEYTRIARNEAVWKDTLLAEAGRKFAELHKRQKEVSSATAGLRRFRNKALTPALAAGWGFAAGLVSESPDRQSLLFLLAEDHDGHISPDPLNGKLLSNYHHDKDAATYRGLGTRQNKAEAQKLAYVFLTHATPKMTRRGLARAILDYGVGEYYRLWGRLQQQEEDQKQAELRRRLEGSRS